MSKMHKTTQYLFAATGLGLLWAVALLVPEATRNVILDDHATSHLLLMPFVSALIAVGFRRFITSATSAWRFLSVALLLPFVGAALWYVLASLVGWFVSGGEATIWEVAFMSVILLPTVVGAVALAAYYVIIPMGLLSQYVMLRVGRRLT